MATNKLFFYLSSQHNIIVKLLIFFFCVSLMVYVMPTEGKFRYSYIKGKVWLHGDYVAPFDFAIKKSQAEIDNEKIEISRQSKRYFIFDDQLVHAKQRDISLELDSFIQHLTGVSADAYLLAKKDRERIKKEGDEWLFELYGQGIVQNNIESLSNSKNKIVVQIRDRIAEEKQLTEYYTLESARNYIALKLYGSVNWNDPELKLFFEKFITPNVFYSDEFTKSARDRTIENISLTRGMVSRGEMVISKGETITPEKFQILESIRTQYEAQMGSLKINSFWLIAGQFVIITMLFSMLLLFLILIRKDIFEDAIKLSFLFSLVVVEVVLSAYIVKLNLVSVYLFPFCIMPIIIRAFFDTRLALFAHLLTMLIIGFLVPNPFEFFVIQMVGGIACIFTTVSMRKRSQLFITITLLTTAYVVCYAGMTLMVEGRLESLDFTDMAWLAGSAALTLFSYPIIYLIEKLFGFTSDVSLLELSDTNNPLLKELAFKAPGTFQHSLQVANLAEAAVYLIGGNTLLVRTGALYHDIGKMELARYFIENQMTGVNPHDELGFDESARIIISHVKHGIRLGRQYGLPENIMDFIRTHHGHSRVQYFYKSFLKNFPDAEVDEGAFRYPGPIPFSRETAVVMMADSVEATSRSLKLVNSESIDQMVENIINQQIADNQFINSDITFKDITAIKKIFKKMLMNIYHVRVEYPK